MTNAQFVDGLALSGILPAPLIIFTTFVGYMGGGPLGAVALTAGAFDSSGHLRVSGHHIQGFAPLSGFRRTLDGWIRLHANYPHHEQRLLGALGATTADGVAAALRSMESLEAEAAIAYQRPAYYYWAQPIYVPVVPIYTPIYDSPFYGTMVYWSW